MRCLTRRLAACVLLVVPVLGQAHFQELIPPFAIATDETGRQLSLDIRFTHPMANGPVMAMGKPERLGVVTPSGREELTGELEPRRIDGKRAYTADYTLSQPGDHRFYLAPAPYWEPSEGVMIQHFTKVVVNAFGRETDWGQPVGLPVEIVPLTRPYGLWTGNVFRGRVIRDGDPVAHARVEVEWRNDGSIKAPAPAFTTQVVRADADGVFSYAMPRAGWWGFSALVEADEPVENPDGKAVPLEQGGLIWVHTRDMTAAKTE